jgi:hypothetical protein
MQGDSVTLTEAHKHRKFCPVPRNDDKGTSYMMHGPFGWESCTPAESAWLACNKDKHVPMVSFYKRKNKRARCYEAFDVFVVEGIKTGRWLF